MAVLEEIVPQEEPVSRGALRQSRFTPDDESLNLIILVQVACESFEVLSRLNYDDLSFGMCGLIKTSFSLVSNVDASVQVLVHDGSHEGNGPLGRVEAHDGDGTANRRVQVVARLSEGHSILPVLAPGPAQFLIIALDPHGWPVTTTLHGVHEHLVKGEWCLRAWATSPHFNGKLIMDVTGPMEAFAFLGVDQAMVTRGTHLDNAIVRHLFLSDLFLIDKDMIFIYKTL